MNRLWLIVAAIVVFVLFFRMAKSKLAYLHPEIRKRWEEASRRYKVQYPDEPQPFITHTFRSSTEQQKLFDQGRTGPGSIVTNAQPGQSLHNYDPTHAFDIAFRKTDGSLDWDVRLFENFARIAKQLGLAWGGDWTNFKDRPHFEAPNYSWRLAQSGVDPTYPNYT